MRYQFDHFIVDCHLAQLSRDGAPLPVEPRVFELLVCLLENRERVVSKEEIIARLWSGRFTSDAAISTCVKSLRKALQDDGGQQKYIQTVRGRGFRFIGELIAQPSAADRARIVSGLSNETAPNDTAPSYTALSDTAPIAQGKPSIIVLPLRSLGAAGPLDILAEALAHELIQALSRLRWLRVIARGTAFQFRQPDVDLRRLGEQLQLRYALSGSVENLGRRLAITIELNDCLSEDVVWADRFEVGIEQVHDTRQAILASVISSLEMYIPQHEASLAVLKTSDNMDAWSHYHLGLRHMFRFTAADNRLAARDFDRAITQDPQFARAYAGKSFTRFQDCFLKYSGDPVAARNDARAFAERGIELDPLDPFTNYNMGRSFWLADNILGGRDWLERSVSLSPNFAQGFYSCSYTEVLQGDADRALQNSAQALSLSPLDPLSYGVFSVRALAFLRVEEPAQAVLWAEKAALAPGAHFLIWMIAAAIYALAGDLQRARYWREHVRSCAPQASLTHFFNAFQLGATPLRTAMEKGLLLAGF